MSDYSASGTRDGCRIGIFAHSQCVDQSVFALMQRNWAPRLWQRRGHSVGLTSLWINGLQGLPVSGLSQHALRVDVAAKVLADNITALMCLAVQADAGLPTRRRCQRSHANLVVPRLLARVLLAVAGVLDLIDGALAIIARTRHRITPGRTAPRHSDRAKPPAHLAYKG